LAHKTRLTPPHFFFIEVHVPSQGFTIRIWNPFDSVVFFAILFIAGLA
jgi:hypothetical protein